MDYMPIQASSVPSERVFSACADTDTKKRGPLDDTEDDHERYNDPDDDVQRSGIAEAHSHENVVMGTVLPSSAASSSSGSHAPLPPFHSPPTPLPFFLLLLLFSLYLPLFLYKRYLK